MFEEFITNLRLFIPTFRDFILPIFGGTATETLGASGSGDDGSVYTYDEDGTLLSRITQRPDGLQQEDFYTDGVRSARTLTDVNDDQSWSTVTNNYDETGRIGKVTVQDDGVLRADTFLFGVRVRTVQTDPDDVNLHDWNRIDVSYDADGAAISRLTRYDDGTDRTETFQDGTRAEVLQEDLVLTARIWSQIETTYDVLGRWIARTLDYDDGVERVDQFSAGIRHKTTLTDIADSQDWEQIQYLYDPLGIITSRWQEDDTGDISLILFQDGTRRERVIQDVDGDMAWEVQVTTYDETGIVDVVEYEDGAGVLETYGPFFADADSFLF